ncbi:hypothetical protein NU219Hw_g2709t1 [Hortaea werneckii]
MNLSPSTDVLTSSKSALETSNDSVLKLIMALRGLDISAESTFDFVLPEGCKEWPAPHYGPYSPHTERPKPGGFLRLRKREANGLTKVGGKKAAEVQRQKNGGSPRTRVGKGDLNTTTSFPDVRDPSLPSPSQVSIPNHQPRDAAPLTLLSLPRELKDLIYTHLVLHSEPLTPQYRPCWKPTTPGDTSKRRVHHRVIRRLPPETPLALVSRQLRHETLSVFYGANTFVFARAAEPLLSQDFNMLDPAWMRRWMRGCNIPPSISCHGEDDEHGGDRRGAGGATSTYLRTMHLRFDDVPRANTGTTTGTITYSLSRTAGAADTISIRHDRLSTSSRRSCACAEDALAEWNTARSREGRAGFVGLVDVAVGVCRWWEGGLGGAGKGGRRVRLGDGRAQARRGESLRCGVCGAHWGF